MSLDISIRVVSYILLSLGLYKIFAKCGVDKRWAFIPVIAFKLQLASISLNASLMFPFLKKSIITLTANIVESG